MKKRIFSAIILLSFLTIIFLPFLAWAQGEAEGETTEVAPNTTYRLNVPLDNNPTIEIGEGKNPLFDYISIWYSFIIGSIGILATVMIMYGGFKWLTSRGNSSQISDAKEKIISAITGLLLAFLSFTILNLINPRLVQITTPGMEEIDYSQNFIIKEIPNNDFSNVGQYPLDQNFQNLANGILRGAGAQLGVGVRTDGLTPEILDVGQSLYAEGINIFVTSAFRPGDPENHGLGQALDLARGDPALDTLMDNLIREGQPAGFAYGDQFPIYDVTFPNGTQGRIINEDHHIIINETTVGNTWHIDLGNNR
ncbi:MAG: pilin [Patescibacteria group bacterium]